MTSKPIIAVRTTTGIGFCIIFDEINRMWSIYQMPEKTLIKAYMNLPRAFRKVGAELEKLINLPSTTNETGN